MNRGLQKRVIFLKHYKLQHHLGLGKCGLSWINSITTPDTRQSFGDPHQLYLLTWLFDKDWITLLDIFLQFDDLVMKDASLLHCRLEDTQIHKIWWTNSEYQEKK